MSVQAKICGLSEPRHAKLASTHGAKWVGIVFFPPSPRHVEPDAARAVVRTLPPNVETVGVLVDPDDAAVRIAASTGLRALQLHGRESPERIAAVKRITGLKVIKAMGIATRADAEGAAAYRGVADMVLFDARPPAGANRPGGNAQTFDWDVLRGLDLPLPWILSGGLTAANVALAVARSGAQAVDVSSGVETEPGVKDADLIVQFLEATQVPDVGAAPVLQ